MLILPKHIGVILDGNRRWAKKRNLPPWKGHEAGARKFEEFLKWCIESGIKKISVYALSLDNIEKRKKREVRAIFMLMEKYFERWLNGDFKEIEKYEIQVRVLGDFRRLPKRLVKLIYKIMKKTAKHRRFILNLLIGYKGTMEILFAIKKIVKKAVNGRVRITPKVIQQHLLENEPIDLIIRTGGRSRLSEFMPLQSAYSEIYVTKTLWPDFSKREFKKALNWFSSIQRNFGK
jgi:tritrans,polycis-undecaprenyl-diphosphate synthase [geranylgeranyl-diphosphate specific]